MISISEFNNKSYIIDVANRICLKKRNNHALELYNATELKEAGISKKEYTMTPQFISTKEFSKQDNKTSKKSLSKLPASFEEISAEFTQGQLFCEENPLIIRNLYEITKESHEKIAISIIQLLEALESHIRIKNKPKSRILIP